MKKIVCISLFLAAYSSVLQAMEQSKCSIHQSIFYASTSIKSWRYHTENPEFPRNCATAVREPMPFFGIYDGYDGFSCARYVRKHLHHNIFDSQYYHNDLFNAICNGFNKTSCDYVKFVERYGITQREKYGFCGASAAIVLLDGNDIVVANVGNSRVVLCHDGVAQQLSQDHTLSNPVEMERIAKAGGKISSDNRYVFTELACGRSGSLGVTRTMGADAFKCVQQEYDYSEVNFFGWLEDFMQSLKLENDQELKTLGSTDAAILEPQEIVTSQPFITKRACDGNEKFLILASAELWNLMTNQEVVDFVQAELKEIDFSLVTDDILQLLVKKLAKHVIQKFECNDNITISIIVFR